jgi:hypothetical protein
MRSFWSSKVSWKQRYTAFCLLFIKKSNKTSGL